MRAIVGISLVLVSLHAISSIPVQHGNLHVAGVEAEADLITDLPGLPPGVNFRMFSGLIRVDGRRSIFYWFVESMKSPKDDPLVLWTNGGPGCSGLGGFLTEQGPFRPNNRGTLDLNPHAWNKIANMIFIEQPAGVGFSPVEGNATYDDTSSAIDNYRFILGFLDRFPEYKPNEFYITSESYGGHYLPTLAMQLVQNGGVNFRGLAVGNPLTYMPYRDYGQYATFAGHQLIPKPLWDSYLRTGCAMVEDAPPSPAAGPAAGPAAAGESLRVRKETCSAITDEMDQLTEGLNPYGLDFPVCSAAAGAAGGAEVRALLRKARPASGRRLGGYFPPRYVPCEDNRAAAYLNRPDVQEAIHVGRRVLWSDCNDTINALYSPDDVGAPMMGLYKALIAAGGLRILVYSGDDDAVCATAGAQMWIWTLGQAVLEPWRPWTTHGQVSGYTAGFAGGFRFATVHGAGHMVPTTRPAQALDLFERFLSGEWADRDPRPPHP